MEKTLREVIAAGEGQQLEFKSEVPSQWRDLAKEIAAFATSSGGTILLGVTDDGKAVGIEGATTLSERDVLIRRIEGVCSSHVKPPITPSVQYLSHEQVTVIAIHVPKGPAPIYYAAHIPYLRHISSSRPAEPEEVVSLIREWLKTQHSDAQPNSKSLFLGRLLFELSEIDIRLREVREDSRAINPWLAESIDALKFKAKVLRELDVPSELSEMVEALDQLSQKIETCAYTDTIEVDGWQVLMSSAAEAASDVEAIWFRWYPASAFGEKVVAGFRDSVQGVARRLKRLADQRVQMDEQNRLGELQGDVGALGYDLFRTAIYLEKSGDNASWSSGLMEVARQMREIETREQYMDGGQSAKRIMDDLATISNALTTFVG